MCVITLEGIEDIVSKGERMTADEWIGQMNPPGVWIYAGKGPRPEKHPYIPGTKQGPMGIELLPAVQIV